MMNNIPEFIDRGGIESIAAAGGVAISIVDESGREVLTANNNSICANLNPSGYFSPECAAYCGKALEKAYDADEIVSYECHAGLDCRAVKIGSSEKRLVAIVGRSFVTAESYRRATARAISGDWSKYSPAAFFENILLTGSPAVLDKVAADVELLTPPRAEARARDKIIESEISSADISPSQRLTTLVERFNREVGSTVNPDPEPRIEVEAKLEPATEENPNAKAQAWRSFFGSILKTDYAEAVQSLLEFLAHQYGFSSLVWLDAKNRRLAPMAAFGELKDRKVRISVPADDERLVSALLNEMPFELGERSKSGKSRRTMHLFPIGIAGTVSAAIAVLDPIDDDAIKKHIARITLSIAPQIEILRLRSEIASGETLSSAVRRFSDNLKQIDADDLWIRLTQNAAEMLKAERASLMIYDEKSDALALKSLIGAKAQPGPDEEIGGRVSKHVFAKSAPIAVADVGKTGLPSAPADRGYKTTSFLSCPVVIGGRTIGVMNFADRACGQAFDKSSLELFLAIAPQLAVAVDRAMLKERAGAFEQLSVTDALTGLLNRRYMEARLSEEIKRSNRHGFPMSFMMLDVDHFKSYNDSYGHPAGDEALKLVGRVVSDTLRGADVAARFGGEEFAILLPQTTGDEAATIAERIRANIEQASFPHRRVTTSIGVASCSAELCISADLVGAADKALYESKRRGRNKVLAFEDMGS